MNLSFFKINTVKKKNWFLRFIALILTIVYTISLRERSDPMSLTERIVIGFKCSLVLNGSLWLCTFEIIRIKFKYFVAVFILFSGFATTVLTPFGTPFALLVLSFYLWFFYDCIKGKK